MKDHPENLLKLFINSLTTEKKLLSATGGIVVMSKTAELVNFIKLLRNCDHHRELYNNFNLNFTIQSQTITSAGLTRSEKWTIIKHKFTAWIFLPHFFFTVFSLRSITLSLSVFQSVVCFTFNSRHMKLGPAWRHMISDLGWTVKRRKNVKTSRQLNLNISTAFSAVFA